MSAIIVGLAAGGAGVLLVTSVVSAVIWHRRTTINQDWFRERWRDMQKLCGNKDTWRQAVIDADMLLDSALKKRRMRGKTQGERMTKAQRLLTDNEGVWFGHKLRLKIESDDAVKLKEKEVKQALVGIRQALKDLGALDNGGGNDK